MAMLKLPSPRGDVSGFLLDRLSQPVHALPQGVRPTDDEDEDDGPSLSSYLERDGTLEQFREFAVHRSAYQLKEADPHSWAMPRLGGPPKAAMVEIQADEYGGGGPGGHPPAPV